TPELLDALREAGIETTEITLHVGYGTFQPVRVERVEDHRVEPETYSIGEDAAASINRAIIEGRRVIAVGTTTTRALESTTRLRAEEQRCGGAEEPLHTSAPPHLCSSARITRSTAVTNLFIYPG